MSRIRSVHPGLYTDEAFVMLSMAARVLLPGLWIECDDNGVFEWKPLTLKMKIFPADNLDVDALLAELLLSGAVKRFTRDGKEYGIARNFRKYQRPKNPSYWFVLPEEYRKYVGLKDIISPKGDTDHPQKPPKEDIVSPKGDILPPQNTIDDAEHLPNLGENALQMEDGVGEERKERKKETAVAHARDPFLSENPTNSHIPAWESIRGVIGIDPDDPCWFAQHGRVAQWLANGWSLDLDILPTVTRLIASRAGKGGRPVRRLEYFEEAIADAFAARTAPVPTGNPEKPHENSSSVVAAADRLIERIKTFDELPDIPPELDRRIRGREGEAAVRVVSEG